MLTLKATNKSTSSNVGIFSVSLEDNKIAQLADEFCKCILGETILIRLRKISHKCKVIAISIPDKSFITVTAHIIKKYNY